jgi:PAS domain S-box-containing protein
MNTGANLDRDRGEHTPAAAAGAGTRMRRVTDLQQRLDRLCQKVHVRSLQPLPLALPGVLLEVAPYPLVLADVDGTMLQLNAAAEQLLGASRTNWIGRSLLDLASPATRARLEQALTAWRAAGGQPDLDWEGEFTPAVRAGVALELRARTMADEHGNQVGWAVAMCDVTRRVRHERELARIVALHRSILATSTDPIVLIDASGVVRDASASVERLLGWPPAELIGRNVSVLMQEPHRSRHDGYLQRYLADGYSAVLGKLREFAVMRKDGSAVTCELAAFRVDVPGAELPMFCGFFRDVTERKRVQEREAAHQAALAAIAESASVLAHEIKNPITGLRHALRAVAMHLGADEQEVLGDLVERMQRLEARIRRSLTFLRTPELRLEPTDLGRVAADVATDLRSLAARKHVTIEVDAPAGLVAPVDAPLLHNVLTNLVTNSIEAIPAAGHVRIRARRGDGTVELVVADDGPGIPPSLRETLFQPFVTTKREGTGLGLMICKRIVEAHHGTIRAGTAEGGGAAFTIALPLAAT